MSKLFDYFLIDINLMIDALPMSQDLLMTANFSQCQGYIYVLLRINNKLNEQSIFFPYVKILGIYCHAFTVVRVQKMSGTVDRILQGAYESLLNEKEEKTAIIIVIVSVSSNYGG